MLLANGASGATVDERHLDRFVAALTAVCRELGLKLHMDGARFANALTALGCSPAEMTWKVGIDARLPT